MSEETLRRIPPKITLTGDRDRGVHYLGFARNKMIPELENEMDFRGLRQYEKVYAEDDGTLVLVSQQHFNGLRQSFIHIHAPFDVDVPDVGAVEERFPYFRGKFFIKFTIGKKKEIPGIYNPNFDPEPWIYGYAWVLFDKKGNVEVHRFSPDKHIEQVGRKIEYAKFTSGVLPDLNYNNFAGKVFEVKGKRFVGYTGCVPLLFREGALLEKGTPEMENEHEGLHFAMAPDFYWGNFHKFHILNSDGEGQSVAWYYLRQVPNFIEQRIGCILDMRYPRTKVLPCKIRGDDAEFASMAPLFDCRGSSRISFEENVWHKYKADDRGSTRLVTLTKNVQCYGGGEKFRLPTGFYCGLDIISVTGVGAQTRVKLYTNYFQGVGISEYRLRTLEEMEEHGHTAAVRLTGERVDTAKSLYWTKQGSSAVETMTINYEAEAYQKYASESWDTRWDHPAGPGRNRLDLIPPGCHDVMPYCLDQIRVNSPGGVLFDWVWGVPYGLHWQINRATGTRGVVYLIRREAEFQTPFWGRISRKILRMGDYANAHAYLRYESNELVTVPCNSLYWNELYCCLGARQSGLAYYKPRTMVGDFDYGSTRVNWCEIRDGDDFSFPLMDFYNGKYQDVVRLFSPNIMLGKGRGKSSFCNTAASYKFSRHNRPRKSCAGHAGREPDFPSVEQMYENVLLREGEYSVGSIRDKTKWGVGGLWNGMPMVYNVSASESESSNDTETYFTDGKENLELPDDGMEYYFMDDRSVEEDSHGVFLAVRKGFSEWRFFHFWEDAGTIKEYTEEILKGAGLDSPQGRASIQCIGVI